MDMDRETYLLGRAALKTKIKALAFAQKRDKAIIRMPRKTKEERKAGFAALKEAGYGSQYSGPCFGNAQGKIWSRRQEITAYLNVYAEIRGKTGHNPPGKDYCSYVFSRYMTEARELFDQATKTVATA